MMLPEMLKRDAVLENITLSATAIFYPLANCTSFSTSSRKMTGTTKVGNIKR